MGRKYPPLTPREIEGILFARGFYLLKSKGDHNFYRCDVKGIKKIVQIDMGTPLVENKWLKLTIKQSGLTREEFYCSTRTTAKKIGKMQEQRERLLLWLD